MRRLTLVPENQSVQLARAWILHIAGVWTAPRKGRLPPNWALHKRSVSILVQRIRPYECSQEVLEGRGKTSRTVRITRRRADSRRRSAIVPKSGGYLDPRLVVGATTRRAKMTIVPSTQAVGCAHRSVAGSEAAQARHLRLDLVRRLAEISTAAAALLGHLSIGHSRLVWRTLTRRTGVHQRPAVH